MTAVLSPVTSREARPRMLRVHWRGRWPAAVTALFMDGRMWPSLIDKLNAMRSKRFAGDPR